ncbi:hypothetical protein SUGI_0310100 [Cryptomeria japonica]|nr:hypothetical protein SUGI_0310100 [Cryptomeria japonica]
MATDQTQQNWTNFSSDVTKLVCSLLGLGYFIYLIQKDARGAYKKRAYWNPGNAFVLSALTIQVLSYLNSSITVNISDKPNFEEVAMLFSNHLLIDSGRLTICVFMGYLLPGMARSGSGGDWGDIFALAISLFTDIVSELYFLHKSKYLFNFFNNKKKFHTIKEDYNYVYDIAEQFWGAPKSIITLILKKMYLMITKNLTSTVKFWRGCACRLKVQAICG